MARIANDKLEMRREAWHELIAYSSGSYYGGRTYNRALSSRSAQAARRNAAYTQSETQARCLYPPARWCGNNPAFV